MKLKEDIKKAITANTKYIAVKMYKPEITEYFLGNKIMTIEIMVRNKKRN